MAPVSQEVPLHTVDRTPEYEEFMTRLRDYHTKRGTTLDPEPKVGANSIDLFKVFNHIVASGGYDKVSEEKLAWRRMASELGIFSNNEASTAFALKEKFYKNLAAFEISTVHGKEPPPKDILEDVTAKGAGLLTRTRENFRPKRESTVGGGPDSATASGDDGTPVRERPTVDFGSSARASRGLREAPAQRVIFQPDTGSSRNSAAKAASNQAMHANQPPSAAAQAQMHVHGMPQMHHGSQPRGPSVVHHPQNVDNMSSQVSAYQPRQHKPLSLRAVATPANSPNMFPKQSQHAQHAQQAARQPIYPGTGTEGPNIYIRCLNALRSRIPSEQAYALNHLVKISYERGDKYRFDSFPGLAEGLVDKALEVGGLYYHVDWTVSWDLDPSGDPFELDGNNGTHDILERVAALMEKDTPDVLQTEILADKLVLITEAVLTIRNMVTLQENAHNMSDYPPVKDLVCIILTLPVRDTLTELKSLALDIAEALTPWLVLGSDDPLYRVLLAQMDSNDRGTILTALRALGRISMNLDATNTLGEVPASLLQHISSWLLLNDDELMDACLDFLYQYTAVVPNLNTMLQSIPTEHLIDHLVRLLAHGARKVQHHQVLVPEQRIPVATNEIATMPESLLQEMLQLEEPDRVHRWVRCFFEEDSESFVTQLAAWQAYQAAFVGPLKTLGQALITPADFIRNSTSVYKDSNAQVLRDPNDSQQKFIIHGIRARPSPLSLDGSTEYSRCMWANNSHNRTERCGKLCLTVEEMWNHVLTAHVGAVKNESGQYDNAEKEFTCAWGDCTRYQHPTKLHLQDLARHISGHVSSTIAARRSSASGRRPSRSGVIPGRTMTLTYEETATMRDERNPALPPQAAGIPLSAVLVLRNIARNVVKTESEEELVKMRQRAKTEDDRSGWNEKLFRPVMPRLFEVLAENKALSPYVASLLDLIRTGSEDVEPEE